MKKESSKKPLKKRVTWTVQPADDVLKAVSELLGKQPQRGDLTKLINDALRLQGANAVRKILSEQIAQLELKKKSLPDKGGVKD